jgi:hypothetical protein
MNLDTQSLCLTLAEICEGVPATAAQVTAVRTARDIIQRADSWVQSFHVGMLDWDIQQTQNAAHDGGEQSGLVVHRHNKEEVKDASESR